MMKVDERIANLSFFFWTSWQSRIRGGNIGKNQEKQSKLNQIKHAQMFSAFQTDDRGRYLTNEED